MKRIALLILMALCAVGQAQNINDALRYGTEGTQGTARFQAMGGAFGALGGDFSAINVNPAGSAVFANSLMAISMGNYNVSNDARYFGTPTEASTNDFELNQAGVALVFKNTNTESDWRKFTLAFNYDMVQNFDQRVFASGNSNEGIDNYFLNFAQGVPFGSIARQDDEFLEDAYLDIGAVEGFGPQQAFLGYYGGVINVADPDDPDNTDYSSNVQYSTVNQDFVSTTSGYNSKFTVNTASQYKDKIFLGASANFHSVLFDRFDEFTETGYDAGPVQRTIFDNLLRTTGSGFSFNLGAIARLNDMVRVGASYQSPTWYRLTEDFSQRIDSDDADNDIGFIDLNQVNLFEPYRIKTPGKLNGSLALVFAKKGLLSLDYSYQDFSQSQLRPTTDPAFQSVNTDISNNLGAVSTLRIGGEYRIERFSLRGGYRYQQSPFNNGVTVGDLNAISGGLGYNFGGSSLDLSLVRSEQERNQRFFDTGINAPAFINGVNTNVTLTYTLNF
ncbi:OmpP1/FadL family transporter [Maribacter sp. 2307ULW6-5]|uniref:OmpP1/FadL family transporter n=1 Tax=Maribacter sp. 2307ULW6-5 TaxID=3386275 RepID=UPI0039BC4351